MAIAPIVACLDSDCLPERTWAQAIVDTFDHYGEKLGAVQGAVWVEETWQGKAFMITSFGRLQAREEQEAGTLTGNNSAYWRSSFLASPFSEDPVFHGPEVEMAASLKAAGKLLRYVPDVRVQHFYEEGFGNFMDFGRYWGWCFLNARRSGDTALPYRGLFNALGPFAPLAMLPAKLTIDVIRLVQRWNDYRLNLRQGVAIVALLSVNAFAVSYGGLLRVLGKNVPEPLY